MTTMSYPVTISRNPENVTPAINERLVIVRFKTPARAVSLEVIEEACSLTSTGTTEPIQKSRG